MPLVQFETMTWLLVGDRVVGCRGFSAGHEIIVMPVGNRWVSTDVGQFQPQRVIAVLREFTPVTCVVMTLSEPSGLRAEVGHWKATHWV